jgi:hypothetical protein
MLTVELLKKSLAYDPKTGVFTRLTKGKSKVGSVTSHGYLRLFVAEYHDYAHRLAWLYMTGTFPPDGYVIDHKNGDKLDNRFVNLRLASETQNRQNVGLRRNNKLGFKGVIALRDKYKAYIAIGSKQIHLGLFNTPELAHAAYCGAAKVLHGSFFNAG